jgi:uncharacterized protein (TIGR03067 family)
MMSKPWFIGILLLAAADSTPSDGSRKDLQLMQGDWAAVSLVRDGFPYPDDDAQALFRSMKDQTYTVYRYDKVIGKGSFSIDATKKPKTIDAIPLTAKGKGEPILGIYELDGNRFKTCFASPGKERPKAFASAEGSGHVLTVWEREKK